MLPDRERHALREIEAELQASDPAFAAAFSGRKLRSPRRWPLLLVLCDITAVVMLLVGLFARDAVLVLWGTVGAGALVAWHIARAEAAHESTEDGAVTP
ncbi:MULTISPECIES: DUF3040 domain-containing protein [unclassified Amycolatopsis]|uniref:DUF3040 domain-containing protein n=1 Tax=unclassified Amycolatopsis TaxID=2618356 RepID=UPI0028762684|nr:MULTISPECIES: DUF3040 domain-containing protein [unclassified Amycolatopsis]MDS0134912.1 DUF3040 domain-containing protein [Amycolatopsis sp. 505]MDS0147912.1 DUF3040 domain-containing protein [Amycolatopsis sp. CM201R]